MLLRMFCLSTLGTVRVPLEITLQFRTNGFFLNASDEIYIRMPRFTSGDGSGASGPSFEIHQHSWATLFQITWSEHEHTKSQSNPFPLSNMTLRVRAGRQVEPTRSYEIVINRSNGLMAQCSFFENDEGFLMGTNATKAPEPQILRPVDEVAAVGPACRALLNCYGHGFCDACRQRCECYDGFGAPLNNGAVTPPRDVAPDCSRRTCQVGPVIRSVPRTSKQAHAYLAECSDNGICDRALGVCRCSPGWGGTACDRLMCPEDCAGHGKCLSMEDLARTVTALPLRPETVQFPVYGTVRETAQFPVYGTVRETVQFPVYGTVREIAQFPIYGTVRETAQFPVYGTVRETAQFPVYGTVRETAQFPVYGTVHTSGPALNRTCPHLRPRA